MTKDPAASSSLSQKRPRMTTLKLQAHFRLLVTTLFTASLLGCGGVPPTPAPVFPNITGNWQFEVGSPGSGNTILIGSPIATLSGSLSSTGGKVTGILTALSISVTPCIGSNTDIQVSGTIDSAGNLNLTAPIAGGVATLTAVVQNPALPGFNGTYQVVGGPCAQASSGLLSVEVPNISGTYAGTLKQPTAQGTGSLTVKAMLVESTAPNADGKYPLTGSVTYSGDCTGTFSFNNGLVSGVNVQSGPGLGEFSGSVSILATQPFFVELFGPTGCAGLAYSGNLTLQ